MRFSSSFGAAAVTVLTAAAFVFAGTPEYEQPPISYSATAAEDRVAALAGAIAKGQIKLERTDERGYLDSLLRALKIPASSQTLVFSKTSFQASRISPRRPRAIYFNDDTYVGYVSGGDVIEIASTDPKLGSIFYTIDQRAAPGLARQSDSCLQCHGESMTRGIPGLLVRSVFPNSDGHPILSAGTFITTHASPLEERWGGWYVTGSSGKQAHMGNQKWREEQGQDPQRLSTRSSSHSTTLPGEVDVAAYLKPHSDVVALMVLEHQVEAHNRMTRAAHGTLRAMRDEKIINDAMGEVTKPNVHSESTLSRIRSNCEPLVEYLLFADEVPLTDQITGSSAFAEEFAAMGPRDSHGRSLREFDLKTRMFRYPCSYLVYSGGLTGLPAPAKQYIYRRLWEVLSGKDSARSFDHLSADDRTSILQILRDTAPDIAKAWHSLEQQAE